MIWIIVRKISITFPWFDTFGGIHYSVTYARVKLNFKDTPTNEQKALTPTLLFL